MKIKKSYVLISIVICASFFTAVSLGLAYYTSQLSINYKKSMNIQNAKYAATSGMEKVIDNIKQNKNYCGRDIFYIDNKDNWYSETVCSLPTVNNNFYTYSVKSSGIFYFNNIPNKKEINAQIVVDYNQNTAIIKVENYNEKN